MSCSTFTQLHDFMCHPEVMSFYSSIRKLQRPKLEEALRIRKLSFAAGDEDSTLRFWLLRFEVQFFHPEIHVPNDRVSEEDAAALRARLNAVCDLARTLGVGGAGDATSEDPMQEAERTAQSVSEVETSIDTSLSTTILTNDTENQLKYRLNSVKLLKVCDLQYTGARGLAAQDFLDSLADFRRFSKIDERVLLDILPCALDLDTRKWYRANDFADWPAFERKFTEDRVVAVAGPRTPEGSPPSTPEASPAKPAPAVSRTLQQLKDSLMEIGLKDVAAAAAEASRRTSICSDTSVASSVPSFVNYETPKKTQKTLAEVQALLLPTVDQSKSRETDKPSTQVPAPFSRTPGSGVQILKRTDALKSQAVVPQVNNINPIGACRSILNNNNNNNNANQGLPKPAQNVTPRATTSTPLTTSHPLSYYQLRNPINTAAAAANQALKYPYAAAYGYPYDYNMPNGYGHY